MSYIYKITHRESGKSYIGRCKHLFGTSRCRVKRHLNLREPSSSLLYKAIKRYGKDAFVVELLYQNVPVELLVGLEYHCINHHNTLSPNGFNMYNNVLRKYRLSDELIQQLS